MKIRTIVCTECGMTDVFDTTWLCQECKRKVMENPYKKLKDEKKYHE